MIRILTGRIAQGLVVLWVAFTLSFILVQLMPGDAALIRFLNPDMGMTPDDIARIRAFYGSDAPVLVQYMQSALAILPGDLGYSMQSGVPVLDDIATNLTPTLQLAGLSVVMAVLLALALAFSATLAPFGWLRRGLASLPALMISVPVFWVGIVLIQVVSSQLGWVPVINPGPWQRLILPVLTLSSPIAAPIAQILLSNIEAVEARPFVAVIRAKGTSRARVILTHVLKNASLPTLAIAGVLLGGACRAAQPIHPLPPIRRCRLSTARALLGHGLTRWQDRSPC